MSSQQPPLAPRLALPTKHFSARGRSIRQFIAAATVAALAGATFAGPGNQLALASGAVTWGGSLSIDEQDNPVAIDTDALAISGGSLDGGYIEFAVASSTATEKLAITESNSPSAALGEVTVVNDLVYLGDGANAVNIGTVDETLDGEAGRTLRVNFSNSFVNSSFELNESGDTDVIGWTEYNQQIILGSTVVEGVKTVDTRSYTSKCKDSSGNFTDNDDGLFNTNDSGWSSSYSVQVSDSDASEGSQALRLTFSATQSGGKGWVIHGPAAASSAFEASQGDVITFAWRSEQSSDSSVAFGYLLNTDDNTQTELLERVSTDSTTWADVAYTIPKAGNYKFVFVAGAYNADCLTAGGSSLWVDNLRVVGDKATASVATSVAKLVTYENTSDDPATSRTVTLTAVDASGSSVGSDTATISITPVNDPPAPSGSATLNEGEPDTLASVTGTLTSGDPDNNSMSSWGISGGALSGTTVSLAGDYGTLEVDTTDGSYEYIPDMTAVKPLDTGDTVTDTFTISANDGELDGTGTFTATINGFTDTEPSPPLINAIVPGDESLTVVFTPPLSEGGQALTNYEYSVDGADFEALDPMAPSAVAFSIGGLTNDTEYDIRIRATNGNVSLPSNEVSGTPSATPTVNEGTIQAFDPSTALTTITEDFTVSGFAPADELLVSIGLSDQEAGTAFALTNLGDSGASLASGFSGYTDGDATTELSITGTPAEVNAALSGLQVKTGSVSRNFSVVVTASLQEAGVVQSGVTGSFYELVQTPGLTWTQARDAAADKEFAGVAGYLVTITSKEENAFIAERIVGADDIWIGASDAGLEGDWRWVSGPEGQNGGTQFWFSEDGVDEDGNEVTTNYSATQTQACSPTATPPVGSEDGNEVTYACWNSGEPDNAGGLEDYAVTNWNGAAGKWNDLAVDNTGTDGYVVEYSEWGGQTFTTGAVVSASSTVNMGGPTLTGTAGTLRASLSWTTPVRDGQTVTDYSVTSTPAIDDLTGCSGTETSCTITGLTAGTSYIFQVAATWDDSATTRSQSVTLTPTAVPAPTRTPERRERETVIAPPVIAPPSAPANLRAAGTNTGVTNQNPPPLSGPILRGTTIAPPANPLATIGGVQTETQTNPVGNTGVRVSAGSVNVGVGVSNDAEGRVVQNESGTSEMSVVRGGATRFSGSGLLPSSTVQVFLGFDQTNSAELARIPVDTNGNFDGSAALQTPGSGAPLPIGRQVIQMVSVDEDGNQAIIDMPINIAQPSPQPEILQESGETPALRPGQSLATRAGEPVAVRVIPQPENKQTTIDGGDWSMQVIAAGDGSSVTEGADGEVLLQLVRDESATISGSGFMPLTRADVWLFSEPTLLGSVDIDENGEFNGEFNIDGRVVTVGEHTMQLQGVGEDGYTRSANLGVLVGDDEAAAATTSASSLVWLWWLLGGLGLVAAIIAGLWWRSRLFTR